MDEINKPETEQDAQQVQDRRRYRALLSLRAQTTQTQTGGSTDQGRQPDEPELAAANAYEQAISMLWRSKGGL